MQIISTLLQTDKDASTSSLSFLQAAVYALPSANQQRRSTEGLITFLCPMVSKLFLYSSGIMAKSCAQFPSFTSLSFTSMTWQAWQTHNYCCRFTALSLGLPGWAGTRKKHWPTYTYRDHQSFFFCFLHLLRSIASSSFNLHAWQSFCTTSVQVFFGLPLGLRSSTSYSYGRKTSKLLYE